MACLRVRGSVDTLFTAKAQPVPRLQTGLSRRARMASNAEGPRERRGCAPSVRRHVPRDGLVSAGASTASLVSAVATSRSGGAAERVRTGAVTANATGTGDGRSGGGSVGVSTASGRAA
eukprot:5003005-Pleurochrysis_carterae.AAC.3